MKVVLLDNGSFVQWVIPMANSLSKLITVVLMIPEQTNRDFVNQISSDVIYVPFSSTRIRNPLSLLVMAEIVRGIKIHNPDILHIQGHGGFWFSFFYPFLKTYPIINEVHDVVPHAGDLRPAIMKYDYSISTFFAKRFTRRFIVHGEKLKKEIVKEYKLLENRVSVMPLGNLSIYKNSHSKVYDEEPHTLLFFGRILKYKGLEYLIKAEPIISRVIPNLKIVIAGEGEPFDKYEKMIKNKDKFMIRNYHITNDELSELFQKTSIVVLPYIEATQSGIVSIAFAYGKPVVITNVGSLSEVVEDGKHGFVVTPRDEKALAEAIIKLFEDNDLRTSMGRNAHLCGKTNLSWDQIAQTSIKIYNKTLSQI